MIQLTFEPRGCRIILRQSSDGSVMLAEDMNANFIVLKNHEIVGVYARKDDAIKEYGRLTRN